MKRIGFIFVVCLVLCSYALAQPATAETTSPEANPADVASIDAILAATYDAISGDVGEARDWDRFRSLFIPEARLIIAAKQPNGSTQAVVLSVDDYIELAGNFLTSSGFAEKEIARTYDQFGDIVQAFSTYKGKIKKPAPNQPDEISGINSFQLMKDGDRWWIINIYWQQASESNPIPEKYLPKEN